MNNRKLTVVFFMASLSFLLTSCAVMRVDVDVYKGPLADEKHVQIQRMAIMATGAKPLLTHSRDALLGEDLIHKLIKDGVYKESHIGALTSKFFILNKYQSEDWHNKSAQLINNTLSLYEDLSIGDSILSDLIRRGKQSIDAFHLNEQEFLQGQKKLFSMINRRYEKTTIEGCKSDVLSCIDVKFLKNQESVSEFSESLFTKATDVNELKVIIGEMNQNYKATLHSLHKILRYTLLGLVELDKDRKASSVLSFEQREAAIDLVATLVYRRTACKVLKVETSCNKESILKLMHSDPAGNAAILLSTDSFLSDNKVSMFGMCESCENKPFLKQADRGSRPFGLIFIPDMNGNTITRFSDRTNELSQKFHSFAGGALGLQNARLNWGLERMIKNYLVAADDDPDSAETVELQNKLSDALIRFAQKLLFISNNRIHLQQHSHDHHPHVDKDHFRNLFNIIEVVGNSILVQANELNARKTHDERITDQYGLYKKAIDQQFVSSIDERLSRILVMLESKKQILDKHQSEINKLNNQKLSDEKLTALKVKVSDAKAKLTTEKTKITTDYLKYKQAHGVLTDAAVKVCLDGSFKVAGCYPANEQGLYKNCVNIVYTDAINNWDKEEKPQKIKTLITVFDEYSTQLSSVADCKTTPQQSFENYVTAKYGDSRIANDATFKEISKLEMLLNKAVSTESTAKDKNKNITAQVTALKNKRPDSETELKFFTSNAIKLIKKAVIEVPMVDSIEKAHSVIPLLSFALENSTDSEKDNALKILGLIKEPFSVPESLFSLDPSDNANKGCQYDMGKPKCPPEPTSIQAMDTLITWLETNHIRMIHDQGPNSESVKQAEAALEEAYRSRAGLIYLRPASSYLRSSYTSSSLQPHENLGWNNMLNDSFQRTIPGLGEDLQNKNFNKALNEIDRQYWQNINTVRVSGGGRSNYVLVKDDVGNWSVRGFTTNYENTVDSLRNMALYNYGEKLGTQLVGSDGNLIGADQAVKIDTGSGGLPGLFADYREDFKKTRDGTYESLAAKLVSPTFDEQIKTKWAADSVVNDSSNLNEINNLVTAEYDSHLKPWVEKLSDAESKENSDLIYGLLKALRSFNKSMASKIEPKLTEGLDADAITAAANAVTQAKLAVKTTTDAIINVTVASRQSSTDKYQQALTFIGEAANRDSQPSKKKSDSKEGAK